MISYDDALRKVGGLYGRLDKRRPDIVQFDDFYEGKQPLKFASREWSEFHKDRYAGFADNWCGVPPDALNERLQVKDFRSGKTRERWEDDLWRAWEANNLSAQSSQGFLQSIVAKRSHVLVWPGRDGTPVVTWEHPATSIVQHDAANPRVRLYGLKSWVDGKTEFAVLYDSTHAYKFQRKVAETVDRKGVVAGGIILPTATARRMVGEGNGWKQWQPRTDDLWPIRHGFDTVPLVEIPNRPRLGRGPISDIHGTIAMQNAINLLWAYLFAAADHASFPARVVMGQEPPKLPILDENGQKIGEKPVDIKELQHGRLLWLTGQKTTIGQWDAAKLNVFTDVIEIGIGHIASQTRVPAHYFIQNWGLSNVNGDTLTATETPLVKKAEEFQLFTSDPLSEIFKLMAQVQGSGSYTAAITPSSIKWKNPAIRSDAQLADALLKKRQVGYPFEYLMELEDVSPADRDRILEMKRREQSDPDVQAIVDRLGNNDDAYGV